MAADDEAYGIEAYSAGWKDCSIALPDRCNASVTSTPITTSLPRPTSEPKPFAIARVSASTEPCSATAWLRGDPLGTEDEGTEDLLLPSAANLASAAATKASR